MTRTFIKATLALTAILAGAIVLGAWAAIGHAGDCDAAMDGVEGVEA